MKKLAIIKKIIGNNLEPYGFEYYGKEPDSWIFSRKNNNVEQFVCIYDNNYYTRIELYTSLDLSARSEINNFYPKWKEEGEQFFWEYTDEQSFIKILEEFVPIIIDFGLEELERMSIPTREQLVRPTKEMQKKLYMNHEEYTNSFISKYNVHIEDINKVITNITVIMQQNQNKDYEEMKETLIEMAAFYGSAINSYFNGRWVWEGDICSVEFISNNVKVECLPLQQIVFNWRDFSEDGLKDTFNDLFE